MNGKESVDYETQHSYCSEKEKFINGAESLPLNKEEQLQVEEKKKCSCLQWLTLKLKLVEDGATPPNWKYIGLVFIALFSSASTLTFLFPFLPEMILTLGYSETEKGTYAGIIASAVFAGRVVGSVFWGWLADRQGRKIVLLITISLNGLFAGLFGFANNIYVAVFFRFMCGVVNGTVGTAKAILYDISDNSNQALSMSMLSISWGMGLIVGPAVGGLLASPAKKWPNAFDENGLFGQFPYLLSSAFPFVTCCIIFVVIYFKFDETFTIKSHERVNQELVISENDEKETQGEHDKNSSQNLTLTEAKRNSLLHLGRSMQSLHGDLETFAYMNKDVIQDQSNSQKSEKNRNCISHSVPDLVTIEQIQDGAKHSKSLCNVAPGRLTEAPNGVVDHTVKPSNNRNEEDERYDRDVQIHNAQNICINRNNVKDIYSTEDQKNCIPAAQEDVKLLIPDKAGVNIQADDTVETESICHCVEVICQPSCCGALRNTSLYRLLRLTDVWTTILMYTVFSFTTIAVEDIFPVFASTTHEYGGLGFSTDEIGLAIGAMVLPLLFLQIKLYPFLVSKMGIRKVFLFSAMVSLVTCQALPTVRLLHNRPVWLWICLIGMQIPFKIATNCCFAGTSLLINNAVTQDLAGQANGLAMMTTAMGRTIAPVLAGSLFSWSVTYGPEIGTPFDSSFPFFTIGLLFFVAIFECLHLNPSLDQQKKKP